MKTNSAIMVLVLGGALAGHAAETTRPVWDSGLLTQAPAAAAGTRAVTDKSLLLAGSHALRMDSACLPEKLNAFSVSAWVRPTSFDTYNEIFRIEAGDGRVLFSFQENGTVLSLGLDVNGVYQECDAGIVPESVLDGCWHFAAATFDGHEQRVFLDGVLMEGCHARESCASPACPGLSVPREVAASFSRADSTTCGFTRRI